MRVLLVEDEPGLVEFLSLELEFQGMTVDLAKTGEQALELYDANKYEIVLLDVILPGISGLDVCKKIRETDQDVAIIMLTALGEIADRVMGLNVGADDYLVKPFAIEELLARVRALYRRTHDKATRVLNGDTIQFGDVYIYLENHHVMYQSQDVELTAREYDLLVFLLRHPNQTWSRQALLERVWGFQTPGDTNVVDVYVGYLRQKLDPDKHFLKTVRGQGYRFEVNV